MSSVNRRQVSAQKQWIQAIQPNIPPSYRYQYAYNPYEARKVYQPQQYQYQSDIGNIGLQQSVAPIPISIPAGASLTPISLQHVQLVPCMCPVAPEEAEKLHEQVGPGPYLAQTYQPATTYSVPQQVAVATDPSKTTLKQ